MNRPCRIATCDRRSRGDKPLCRTHWFAVPEAYHIIHDESHRGRPGSIDLVTAVQDAVRTVERLER